MISIDESLDADENHLVTGNCAKPDKVNNMGPREFRHRLVCVRLSLNGFADITGANPRTVLRWDDGEQDIPKWVGPFLDLVAAACPPKDGETPARYKYRLELTLLEGSKFYV